MKLPNHWHSFIKIFQKKFDSEIVYGLVHIFQDEETITERFTTYEFETYLPDYIPVADDSGGQVAVIYKSDKDILHRTEHYRKKSSKYWTVIYYIGCSKNFLLIKKMIKYLK